MNKVGGYGLQVHSNTDNIIVFIGFLYEANEAHTIEN